MKIIINILRTVIAATVSYAALAIIILFPVWCWGWIADPIDLTNISILKIILILVIAVIILNGLWYWIMALVMLPGGLIKLIAPPKKWIWITTASLITCWMLACLTLIIIASQYDCITDADGRLIAMPMWMTIYTSICTIIGSLGLLGSTIFADL